MSAIGFSRIESNLHWFRDRSAALKEMHRVLRPGGQLLLLCATLPGFGEWFILVDGLLRTIAGPATPPSVPNLPTGAEVGARLLDAGFVIEHMANPIQVQVITDVEPFVRLMSTVAPHPTSHLSPEEQELFEHLVAAAIRSRWPTGFPSTWAACEAVCNRVQ